MKNSWIHLKQSPKYLRSCFVPGLNTEVVEREGVRGVRTVRLMPLGRGKTFPIIFERFVSQKKPPLVRERGFKVVTWNRWTDQEPDTRVQKESGFFQTRGIFFLREYPIGYIDLQGVSKDNYFREWKHSVKNERSQWMRGLQSGKVSLATVSVEEFREAYKEKSDCPKIIQSITIRHLERLAKIYATEDISCHIIRLHSGQIVAGVCILDDRETGQSVYQYAFIDKTSPYKYVGVSLIDLCIQHALEKKFAFLNLTAMYEPRQDSGFRGFAHFKMKFRPHIARFLNAYMRVDFFLKDPYRV